MVDTSDRLIRLEVRKGGKHRDEHRQRDILEDFRHWEMQEDWETTHFS